MASATYPHTVAQGECIRSIARRHGYADPDVIWQHPDNADLRKRRPSPNVLAPGDVVRVPERDQTPVPRATGRVHPFRLRRLWRALHVTFVDAAGDPVADTPYVLRVGGQELHGRTDGSGSVREDHLDPLETQATLELTALGVVRTLIIGGLDPHDQDSGQRQRLENLGYDDGDVASFARDRGLPEDADLDTLRGALRTHSKS